MLIAAGGLPWQAGASPDWDWLTWFNLFEACYWLLMGTVIAICGWPYPGRFRGPALAAFAFFVMFSTSEVIEMWTGAWWKPWWLIPYKGVAIVGIIASTVVYSLRRKKQRTISQAGDATGLSRNP